MSQAAGSFEFWVKAEMLQSALDDSEDLKVEMLAYQKKYPEEIAEEKGEERYKALMQILVRTVSRESEEKNCQERERLDTRAIERMGGKVHTAAPAPNKGSGKKRGKGKGSQQPGKGGKGAGKG